MIQLFCWNIFHTIFNIKIKTFSLANWALSLSKSLRHEAHTKTFFLNAKPTWKVPQSFPIRIDCWKKCSTVIWGNGMESFSSNWQDYNFNQKTSSTWPKFSIGYSPYAVPCLSLEKSLILAKCSVSCGHSLGFQQKSLPKSWMKKQQETHLEHNLVGTTNAGIGS